MMFFCFILLYETKSRALGQHIFTFFSCGYSETGGGQALTPLDTLFTIDIAEVQRFLALGARAAMRTAALQERRNRQILADIVRAYITTGEPVSSRAISKSFEETLSTATIRNVMADLEDSGFLRSEEHTSELQSRLHLVCRLLLEKKKNAVDSYAVQRLRTTHIIPRAALFVSSARR